MKLHLTIEVWKKGHWYLARTPELDFISQGRTKQEAKDNLLEVLRIQFAEMKDMNTLKDYLMECGIHMKDDDLISPLEVVECEKSIVSI